MKKVFTFFAAMALLASVSIAQRDHRMQPGEKPVVAPAAMFKAQLMKAANTVATPAKDAVTISTFPWTEDFETGTAPTGFTFVDADGDGFNWDYTYLYNYSTPAGHNGSLGMIGSASYDIDGGTALTPNNWMILPAFQIPAGSTDFTLSWYEKSQDANYANEYYSVYINTTGATVANFTATTAVYSGLSTSSWVKKTVNLSSYAGQTIYIAFRHHNCTDMFYLDIDDIRVGGPELPELVLNGPSATPTNTPVTFYASSSVSTLSWFVDGTLQSTTADSLVTTFTTVGMHQIVVEATNTLGTVSDTLTVNVFSCYNITLPYVPNFEGGLGCWTSRSDSTESGWYASVDMFESDPEGQVLSISAESYMGFFMFDFPTDNWLFSPEITLPATGEYEIAWQVKPFETSYDGDHYGVYVISGTDTTLLLEESLTGMTDYVQRMAVIPSTVSGDFQVAFRHFNSEGGYVIILDNIQIRALTAPEVNLEGPAAAEKDAPVTFTAAAPNATAFVWSVDGVDANVTGNTLTTSFTTNGMHTVQVIASNTVGADTASMTVEVYTCTAIDNFPYTQDFETGIRCWNTVSADPANNDRFGIDTNSFSGNQGFRFSSYNSAEDYNQYLISPELILPQGEYMVKFMYKGYTTGESFSVLASTTTNDVTAFTEELGTYATTATEWTEVGFLLPAGTKYVAINYYGEYQYFLYIDDVTIKALDMVPTVELDGPETAEAGESVTFVANAPLATSFIWTVDGAEANTTGNTLTTSFATAGNHTVQVIGTNSIGNSTPVTATVNVFSCEGVDAPWVEGFEGTTQCWKFVTNDEGSRGFIVYTDNQQYAYAHGGTHSLIGTYSDDFDVDQWAISPVINMPANANGYKLSFYARTTTYEGINSTYEVLVSEEGSANLMDFEAIYHENSGDGTYQQHVFDMSEYAGKSIRIAFRNITEANGDALFIDDIELSNTVGIDEVSENGLSLYPNPASTMVTVNAEGVEGNVTVQVVDLNGRVMMQQQGNAQSFRFDVSTLAQGAYFVRLTGENVNAVRKLIVK